MFILKGLEKITNFTGTVGFARSDIRTSISG
jgi:hypothetical protein